MAIDIIEDVGRQKAVLYCNTSDLPLPTETFSDRIEAEHFLLWWDRENGNYGEESDLRNLNADELAQIRNKWADEYLDEHGLTKSGLSEWAHDNSEGTANA